MARLITLKLSLIFFSFLYAINASTTTSAVTTAAAANPAACFITTSCLTTRYPAVCVNSLIPYSSTIHKSPRLLAMMALSISVKRAQSTKGFVAKLGRFRGLKSREYAALKDCLEEVSESVDRLSKSVSELKKSGRAGSSEFKWHMSNLKTWVSGALTDDGTCTDGFAGRVLNGRIKSSIRAQMSNVARVTSNALALCNNLG